MDAHDSEVRIWKSWSLKFKSSQGISGRRLMDNAELAGALIFKFPGNIIGNIRSLFPCNTWCRCSRVASGVWGGGASSSSCSGCQGRGSATPGGYSPQSWYCAVFLEGLVGSFWIKTPPLWVFFSMVMDSLCRVMPSRRACFPITWQGSLCSMRVHEGPWQKVMPKLSANSYDLIFYDPLNITPRPMQKRPVFFFAITMV